MKVLYIGTLGLLGVFSRYYIGELADRYVISNLPLATFFINIIGSFLIGIVYALSSEQGFFSPELKLGIMVGFLGGFTTFSSFCLEPLIIIERGEAIQALLYLGLSPIAGMGSAFAGITVVRKLMGVIV